MRIERHFLRKEAIDGFVPSLTLYLLDKVENGPLRPMVIIFPGGAYINKAENWEGERVAIEYNRAGFNAAVVDYSVSPIYHPQPLLDAMAAIRFVRENAISFGSDPNKTIVLGFSAGGHLAASSAVLAHTPAVQKALGITGEEACPNAVVLGYPVITTGALGHQGSTENLCGSDAALRAEMSLENQIRPGLPPFFVWHTVTDESVPVQNALLLANALEACDIPYELHLFAKGQHGMSTCTNEVNTPSAENSAWVPLCTRWLANVLDFRL